ncbi:unnamed protein product [Brassica oleracea var. botrytis]|uniref:Uncharacterized protein n=3 Tax=Brassica TaxID=3705 RepID=A0A0D3AMT0_BRAOL|nr:unnamed protein product [Brassica napus]CDY14554.1 BnaC03g49050D [Brassica napus]VDD21852.1 unnamed protein product [Brassica oleracea]
MLVGLERELSIRLEGVTGEPQFYVAFLLERMPQFLACCFLISFDSSTRCFVFLFILYVRNMVSYGA